MKKLPVILFLFFGMISCNEKGNETNETLESAGISDTLILGFTFDMSKKEYRSHLKKLKKDGKVGNTYKYLFDFGPTNEVGRYAYASFHPMYENDKLWELRLIIEGKREVDIDVCVFSNLSDLYKEKYGSFEYGDAWDGFQNTWIFAEMEVELICTGFDCQVTYTDIVRKKEFENQPLNTSDI